MSGTDANNDDYSYSDTCCTNNGCTTTGNSGDKRLDYSCDGNAYTSVVVNCVPTQVCSSGVCSCKGIESIGGICDDSTILCGEYWCDNIHPDTAGNHICLNGRYWDGNDCIDSADCYKSNSGLFPNKCNYDYTQTSYYNSDYDECFYPTSTYASSCCSVTYGTVTAYGTIKFNDSCVGDNLLNEKTCNGDYALVKAYNCGDFRRSILF